MNDYDRIESILREHGISNKKLAEQLLQLLIDIAGERIIAKERAEAEIYRAILTNKMVKPEFTKTIYQLMQSAEEKSQ